MQRHRHRIAYSKSVQKYQHSRGQWLHLLLLPVYHPATAHICVNLNVAFSFTGGYETKIIPMKIKQY